MVLQHENTDIPRTFFGPRQIIVDVSYRSLKPCPADFIFHGSLLKAETTARSSQGSTVKGVGRGRANQK
jgi:hypothetical protein